MKTVLVNEPKNKRPSIHLQVMRVEPSVWENLGFSKIHYLTSSLNKAGKCFLFTWNDVPVGFICLLNSPRKGNPYGHNISRVCVLSDFQGMGISSQIINFCGGILKANGDEWYLYLKTIHDKMGSYLERSEKWEPTSYNGKLREKETITAEGKKYKNRLARRSYCFKYVGEPIFGYEELLKPISELREKRFDKLQLDLFPT
jgi:GNAT superfamily N-acetyltransferase